MSNKPSFSAAMLALAVRQLLAPLMRILLERGISFDRFEQWAKLSMLQAAQAHFELPGRKLTTSRMAVLTGLSRKEVSRLLEDQLRGPERVDELESLNRATRVVAGWRRRLEALEQPLDFAIRIDPDPSMPEALSFRSLVKEFSGDMPARAVLDELLRSGAIAQVADRVKLSEPSVLPQDEDQRLAILGSDTADLIATIGHNLRSPTQDRFFQRKVMYDNLSDEGLPVLAKKIQVQAAQFVAAIDRLMASFDRDSFPDIKGSGRQRAMLGIYFFHQAFAPAGELPGGRKKDKRARRDSDE
jgi:Family of unknown function (DUF6502)